MTKFDIRIRRKQFTKSRIERHKDFQNLLGNYDRSSRKKTRGVMVLVFLLILIIAILLAFFGALPDSDHDAPKEKSSENTAIISYLREKNSDICFVDATKPKDFSRIF